MIFREAFHRLISGALGIEPYPGTVPQDAALPAAGYFLTSPVQAARTLEGGITLQSHNYPLSVSLSAFMLFETITVRMFLISISLFQR